LIGIALFAGMKSNVNWPEQIQLWRESGLNKKAYCQQRGLTYQLFLYHLSKLEKQLMKFERVVLTQDPPLFLGGDRMEYHFSGGGYLVFNESQLLHVLTSIQGL